MPVIRKAKVEIKVPTTPQEAADLAKTYLEIDEQRSDIQKLRDAQNDALKKYIKDNHLEDDPQAVPFETSDGAFLCAVLKVVPTQGIDLRYAPNDLVLWMAGNGLLTVSMGALDKQNDTKEYVEAMKLKQPTGGRESIEFVAVEN